MTINDASSTVHDSMLTALFNMREDALKAVADLKALGISESAIHLHTSGSDERINSDWQMHGSLHTLDEFSFPSEDRDAYTEGLLRGGCLITVTAVPSSMQSRVIDALDGNGSIDLDERTSQWRAGGWKSGNDAEGHSGADHLGASDHVGQPRAYAESALGALSKDPLPTRRDAAVGRGRARAYVTPSK